MDKKNIVDDRIDTINRILDTLDRLEKRIEQLNVLIWNGGCTADEFRRLVSERSGLIKARDNLEKKAKRTYKMKIEDHGDIEITGVVEINN